MKKKVQLKEDKTNPDIISYGFGEYRIIQDYPIRGRATYLHVRKRKWLDKSSNEIFSYDWDLSEFDGSPDKPGGLSIQLCKSEKKEFYIRYSS